MKALLLPLLLAVFGTGAGVGAGFFLTPAPQEDVKKGEAAHDCPADGAEKPKTDDEKLAAPAKDVEPEAREYVKFANQFVVPLVDDSSVRSLVVISLSVEVEAGQKDLVFSQEPKLRDMFLQIMLDHANTGQFDEGFATSHRLDILRRDFRLAARKLLGQRVRDVLITEIARQDV